MNKFVLTASLVLTGLFGTAAFAQQQPLGLSVRKSQSFNYSPQSPWSNGRIYKTWTGHGGWFYNCDCEESKRNSPYIDWKTNCYTEVKQGAIGTLQHDINEIRARVRSGKCLPSCWPRIQCPDCGEIECDVCKRIPARPIGADMFREQMGRQSSARPPESSYDTDGNLNGNNLPEENDTNPERSGMLGIPVTKPNRR